jgi:hypothetical protein
LVVELVVGWDIAMAAAVDKLFQGLLMQLYH